MDICNNKHQGDGHQGRSSTPIPSPLLPLLLSINRLLALYHRERLLVHPLCWTDRQLALLGCRINSHYSHPNETNNGTVEESAGVVSSKSDPDDDRLAKRLNRQLSQESMADVVEQLLKPLNARRILFQMEFVSLCRRNLPIYIH